MRALGWGEVTDRPPGIGAPGAPVPDRFTQQQTVFLLRVLYDERLRVFPLKPT